MARNGRGDPRHGRDAQRPGEVPGRGWKDIAWRVKDKLGRDRVSLVAAGLGLFALLAAFPAMVAMVSIYGLVASPDQVVEHVKSLEGAVPGAAVEIFSTQLSEVAQQQSGALGFGVLGGLLMALWSARKGMVALMQACNIAYDEDEKRGFVRMALVSLAFTLGAIVYFLVVMSIGVALPVFISAVVSEGLLSDILSALRWPVLWLFIVLALAVIYRFAPSRQDPQWRWVSPGSVLAATLWVIGSVAFAIYVRNFGNFGATYGAMGGVVILLLWLYLSGYVVILGAEVNAEIEHQTAQDSTAGPDKPMGGRGASVADRTGEARE